LFSFIKDKLKSLPPARHILLFVSLVLLFLALGLDTKRYESLQLAGLCSVYCLLREKPSLKSLKNPAIYLPLIFILYVIFRPFNFMLDIHLGIKMLLAFSCGIALIKFFPNHYHIPILVFPLTLAIIFINSYFNNFEGQWIVDRGYKRFCMHVLPDPNLLGYTLGISLVFLASLKDKFSNFGKLFIYVIAILNFIPLMMCTSRSPLAGLAAFIIFSIISPQRKRFIFLHIFIVLILFVSFYFMPDSIIDRLSLSFQEKDKHFSSRTYIWDITLTGIKNNLYFGDSSYVNFFSDYLKKYPNKYPKLVHDPHNFLLGFLFKYGIIGAILFLLTLLYYLIYAQKNDIWFMLSALVVYVFFSGLGAYYFDHTIGIINVFIPLGISVFKRNR